MRASALYLLALPAAAVAQDQVPLFDKAKGWYEQAASFAKSAAASGRGAAASQAADVVTTTLTWDNWRATLRHSGAAKSANAPEPWLVYITGGNKTCYGRCARADRAWNEAVTSLAVDTTAPKLGSIDCEANQLLCGALASRLPSLWHFLLPPRSSDPTRITIVPLNLTSVTADDITSVHTRQRWLEIPDHEGLLHPFDGWVAKNGLLEPMAYALFYISKIPPWAFMIFISMFSRYFVNKRMPGASGSASGAAPAAGSAPAAGQPQARSS